ncbi:hypothetical protein ACJMK2_003018 [Sinanodonta woodiana]|uniref:G-protein coupled receptors family 1 profile domain-containing protein n=1 Tax=Sinanodonta woodiana TaxID=1069815 RepID=A0ABD3Y077_SINWO
MFTPLKDLPGGKNWTLDELNERQVQLLIPVIIFISIAMVVGTVAERNVTETNLESTLTQNERKVLDDAKSTKDLARCINMESKENIFNNQSVNVKSIRVSKTLFVVTVFFVLSFAPFLSLEVITFLDNEQIDNLDNTSTVFYQLFWRSFAINFMLNPFIYGVMDRRFRLECRKLVLKLQM